LIKIIPIEDTFDQVNQPNQVIDQYGGQKEESSQGEEPENHEEGVLKNTPNNLANDQKDPLDSGKNSYRLSSFYIAGLVLLAALTSVSGLAAHINKSCSCYYCCRCCRTGFQ
jgi:hypothetical protein